MKKILVLGISILTLIACNNKNETAGNLQLSGTVKGLNKGVIYIQKSQDTTIVIMDSIVFNGSSDFEKSIQLDSPQVLYFTLDRGATKSTDNNLVFFAEPGKITIDTNLKQFYADAKVTGSKNNVVWEEFKAMNGKFIDEGLVLKEKELKNNLKFNSKTADSINEMNEKLTINRFRYTAQFAATHGDYEVTPYIVLTEIPEINISYLDTINAKLTPKVKKSKYGKIFTDFLAERKAEAK